MINEPKYDGDLTTKSYVDRATGALENEVTITQQELETSIGTINKTYGAAPNPPYFVGNLYVDGTNLYRCKTERLIGSFDAADWELATAYPTTSYVDDTYTKPADFAVTGTVDVNGGRITAGSIASVHYVANTTGMKINLDNDTIDSKNFKVNSEGIITATQANIEGTINATAGTIGGLEILPTKIRTTNKYTGFAASTYSGDPAFWAGNVDPWENAGWSTNMPFYVTNQGYLKATNATIQGAITATSGTFDNCTITGTSSINVAAIPNLSAGKITSGMLEIYNGTGFLRMGYTGSSWTNHPYVSALNVAATAANPGSGNNPGNQSISFRNGTSRTTTGSTIAYISHGWNGSTRFHTINNMNISSTLATAITAGTYTQLTAGTPHAAQLGENSGSVYIASANNTTSHINLKAGGYVYAASYSAAGNYDGARVTTVSGNYSSKNVKKNIKKFKKNDYKEAIDLLEKLNIYNYTYKYTGFYKRKKQYGFILDEIKTLDNKFFDIIDEVGEIKDGGVDFSEINGKGKKITVKNYNPDVLDKYLLTVCKAQQMKIDELEKRLEKLEGGK